MVPLEILKAVPLLALIALSGCADRDAEWVIGRPEFKVKDSLAAIMIAQDACRPEIEKLTARQRQDFFERQQMSGWRATLSGGVWTAGVSNWNGLKSCYDMSVEIDAWTGKAGDCGPCIVVT